MAIANNKVLQKAEAEYTYLTGDAAQRRLEELRVKWAIDRAYGLKNAEEKGEHKGSKEKAKQIAKNMLNKNMKISEIIELTGLTEEEINKINKHA